MSDIRYFIFSEDLYALEDEDPIMEVSESEFITFNGQITYERHTMRENGVTQICLTKYPDWMMRT